MINQVTKIFFETGWWEELHLNGSLHSHGIYNWGMKIGTWNYYYPTPLPDTEERPMPVPPIGKAVGQLMCRGMYNDSGQKQGFWQYFTPTGKPLMIRFYRDGKIRNIEVL